MAFVTFRSFRVPRVFLVLLVCVAVIAWIGYQFSPFLSTVPTMSAPDNQGADPFNIEESLPFAELGERATDFALKRLDGSPVALSSYSGKPVILYFWATWCPYCIDGFPTLNALQRQYESSGLEILAIDILESADKVRQIVRRHNVDLTVLLDETGRITETYLVKAVPTYVFIDREGVYRDVLIGAAREGAVEGRLLPLVESIDSTSTS